ncbi:MAG: hypothetical protein CR982_03260 [Candidatus Cloacimonadota bacterium]|nr:MAG: hypothetical protein CR982_03260 [Candidatus Cloacimonadota bacterium]PIE77406.1 MAG: hypothetical protein CSA15_13070 [Candidatus Delongbacteria bacterium]
MKFNIFIFAIVLLLFSCSGWDKKKCQFYSLISLDSLKEINNVSILLLLDFQKPQYNYSIETYNNIAELMVDSVSVYISDINKIKDKKRLKRIEFTPKTYLIKNGVYLDSCYGTLNGNDLIKFIGKNEKAL